MSGTRLLQSVCPTGTKHTPGVRLRRDQHSKLFGEGESRKISERVQVDDGFGCELGYNLG